MAWTTKSSDNSNPLYYTERVYSMLDMIFKMQEEVKMYSFRFESSGVQQEYSLVDSVKYHSVRKRRGLCCHLHQMSTEQDMPLQEDWRFSRLLTHIIARQLVQKAQV
jgi:hypothetical protein